MIAAQSSRRPASDARSSHSFRVGLAERADSGTRALNDPGSSELTSAKSVPRRTEKKIGEIPTSLQARMSAPRPKLRFSLLLALLLGAVPVGARAATYSGIGDLPLFKFEWRDSEV